MNTKPIKTVQESLDDGSIVLEYNLMKLCWVGRDKEGNHYFVLPSKFGDGLLWTSAYCDQKWYRVCTKEDLGRFQVEVIPIRNKSNNR